MPPGKNSVPLEKVLLQMDLTRGLDERSRPEVGGEQSKLITRLENLIQEESGAWVKRPGLIALTSDLSAAGILRLIRTQGGLAACATDSRLYDLQGAGGGGAFLEKGYIPEFKLEGRMVGSSAVNTHQRVLACASNDEYDVIVTEGGFSATGNRSMPIIVTERATGQQIQNFDLASVMGVTSGSFTPQAKIAFIPGGDLHIWAWTGNALGSPLTFAQMGIGTTPSPTTIDALNQSPLTDINVYPTGSIVTYGTTCRTMTTSLVNTARTGHTRHSVEIVGTEAYILSTDTATGRAMVEQVDTANINGAAIASFVDASLTFPANTTPGIAYDGVGSELFVSFEDTATFPRIRTYKFLMGAAMTLDSTIYGWRLLSTPFRGGLSSRVYAHLCKDETGLAVQNVSGCHVIVNLSEAFSVNHSNATSLTDIVPVAACLDPYLGVRNTQTATYIAGTTPASTTWPRQRYFQQSLGFPGNFTVSMAVQVTARAYGFMAATCSDDNPQNYTSHSFGSSATIIAGGATTAYDGRTPYESGFFDYPVFTAVDSGVAGNVNGSVNYVALYKKVDAAGNVTYSRCFGPISLTVASKRVTVTAHACHVTNSETPAGAMTNITVELYRTQSGGTQYYLCADSQVPVTATQSLRKGAGGSAFYVATDDLSDASLALQPLLFRQPGSFGTSLDRYPGPGGHISCQHKDRSFITDTVGNRVYYSSFIVDGEGLWFSPLLSLQAHGGNGPITGLVSMDGRLLIFKRDAIFIVDGDGPPENGGTGMEFSPPARVATEYGCVDHRSIVQTPDGIMYRSHRGIEILTRSLQVKWLGERVQDSVDDHPYTKSAILDSSGRVRFMVGEYPAATNGVEPYAGMDGIELVYDTSSDSWSTSKYWVNGTYGRITQTTCIYDHRAGTHIAPTRTIAHADDIGSYKIAEDGAVADNDGYVPWVFETGWVRPTGPQGRHRFQDALFLGRNLGPHKLRMSLAYNYEDYDQSRVWDEASIGDKALEELNIQPKAGYTQPVSFRLKVEDVVPDGFSVSGQNLSVDLLGICFVVSPKAGAQQVAEYKKG